MAGGLIEGARVQALASDDLVIGELWNEDNPPIAELVAAGHRARLRLTQAVASLVVHEVGQELRTRATAPGGGGLDRLVDDLRVGVGRNVVTTQKMSRRPGAQTDVQAGQTIAELRALTACDQPVWSGRSVVWRSHAWKPPIMSVARRSPRSWRRAAARLEL